MRTAITGRSEHGLDFDLGKLCFDGFLAVSLFVLIDPFYSGYGAFRVTRDLGPLKYAGLAFGLMAVAFVLLGQQINGKRGSAAPWRATLGSAWAVFLFFGMVFFGSLMARFHLGIQETFLPMALSVLGFPVAVILFWGLADPLRIARRFLLGLLYVMPVVIGWVVAKRFEGGQAFHIEIFLFVPLAVYVVLSLQRRWIAWGIAAGALLLALASHKNTAYLTLLVTIAHLTVIGISRQPKRRLPVQVWLLIYLLGVALLIAALGAAFLLINRAEYLPSGNVSVRLITYLAALDRLVASPILGTGFIDTTLVDLGSLTVLGKHTLVSHSDALDILSHGGLVGALIFSLGILRVLFRAFRLLRERDVSNEVASLVHVLGLMVVCGVITAAFNSPLITAPVGILFWFSLGLLAAVTDYGGQQTRPILRKG